MSNRITAKTQNRRQQGAWWKRAWNRVLRLNFRFPTLALIGFFIAGIIFWGGFNTALELTNTESFCISCHEMREYLYLPYTETIHFKNPTGVRATCPDCHVPREWTYKVIRKIRASNELYHSLRGSIDTPEAFKAKRLALARNVWAAMEATDSRECRNCHDFVSMDLDAQEYGARRAHEKSLAEGKTCIECHQGIAHGLPEEYIEAEHERYERENVPCSDCHPDMPSTQSDEEWWDWDK